ncbi:hypothetical protein B0H14DRAFT_2609910 [Mycena olivaceomarginata]|nr:hypothetical protein B0H14DRAFT_2609910 [Mycena olivaceomarginata]
MASNTGDFAWFDAAADFTTGEVMEYRRVMFPPLLGDSMHVPFLSVEDAPGWMTARGYALYQELNLAERLDPLRGHRYASLRELRAYREQVVGEAYVNHPFFQVDRADDWVAPAPFNTWMRLMRELEEERGRKANRFEAGSIRSYTPVHGGSVTRVVVWFSESPGAARHVCYSLSSNMGTGEPVDTSQAWRDTSQLVVAVESASVCDINNPIWKPRWLTVRLGIDWIGLDWTAEQPLIN